MTTQVAARYDAKTILLHWLTALLVAALWCMGQTIDWYPRALRIDARSAHITVGLILAVVLALRVVWRGTGGRALPAADSGLLHMLARAMHYLLYLLAIGAVALGVCNAWVRGDTLFGLFSLPGYAPLRRTVGGLHAEAANILLILAGLHALAALFHHFFLRDGTLRRMLPR